MFTRKKAQTLKGELGLGCEALVRLTLVAVWLLELLDEKLIADEQQSCHQAGQCHQLQK